MYGEDYIDDFGEIRTSSLKVVRDVFESHEPLVEETRLDDFNPRELRVYYSEGFEEPGRFDVRWSKTNSYNFHYTEGEDFDFRYDRHPNDHSPEKHFHAPGDTQREDATTSCVEVEQDRLVTLAVASSGEKLGRTKTPHSSTAEVHPNLPQPCSKQPPLSRQPPSQTPQEPRPSS